MAQLKDTTIDGNLNVDGEIQIGDENVSEYMTFKQIDPVDVQGSNSITASSVEEFMKIVLEYVGNRKDANFFVFSGVYDGARYIAYIAKYGTGTASQSLFMTSSYVRAYRASYANGEIDVKILDDFNSDYGIKSGDDLNNYTEEGLYWCSSQNTAATLSNCPTSVAFRLEVKGTAGRYGATRYWQIIYSNAETEKHQRVWRRVYSPSGWSGWQKDFSWNDLKVYSGTKTTNSNGNITTGLDPASYQIISASFTLSDGATTNCSPYVNGGSYGIHVANNSGTSVASKSGTLRYVYINI